MERTKHLIETFPPASIKHFQYLHAVQQQVAQFIVDLIIEKRGRLRLCTTLRQLEDVLAQLRRQINEPSPSSLPVPFKVDQPCSTAFQDNCAVNKVQISKPSITNTLKRTSSTASKPLSPDQPRGLPTSKLTPGRSSSELGARVKQKEEEITKAKNCRETITSIYRSQFTCIYDRFRSPDTGGTDTILWKLTSLGKVFDTAKSATRLDDAAKDPNTHYKSPVYRTHPHGNNSFVQFYPYGLESAAGNHSSIMFAFFPGDYDGSLKGPFSETIHLSVHDQHDPQNKWTITFAASEKISFPRSTREPYPTLTNFNFFQHS